MLTVTTILVLILLLSNKIKCNAGLKLVTAESTRKDVERLQNQLKRGDITVENFSKLVFAMKSPSDETNKTQSVFLPIIEKISLFVPVTVFDDGNVYSPKIHMKSFDANLVFITPVRDREIDFGLSRGVTERMLTKKLAARIFPCLKEIDQQLNGSQEAIITMPKCEEGPLSIHRIDTSHKFITILKNVLLFYVELMSNTKIKGVYVDDYRDYSDNRPDDKIKILYRDHTLTQLSEPFNFGQEFRDCILYSFAFCSTEEIPRGYVKRYESDLKAKVFATDYLKRVWNLEGVYDESYKRYVIHRPLSDGVNLIPSAEIHFYNVPENIAPSLSSYQSSEYSSSPLDNQKNSHGIGPSGKNSRIFGDKLWTILGLVGVVLAIVAVIYFIYKQCSKSTRATFTDGQAYQQAYPGGLGTYPPPVVYTSSPIPVQPAFYNTTPGNDETPPSYSSVYEKQ